MAGAAMASAMIRADTKRSMSQPSRASVRASPVPAARLTTCRARALSVVRGRSAGRSGVKLEVERLESLYPAMVWKRRIGEQTAGEFLLRRVPGTLQSFLGRAA